MDREENFTTISWGNIVLSGMYITSCKNSSQVMVYGAFSGSIFVILGSEQFLLLIVSPLL